MSEMREVARELAEWRETKATAGGRIPERFWKYATALAAKSDVKRVSKELRLPEKTLQMRVDSSRTPCLPKVAPSFVEMLVASPRVEPVSQDCGSCLIKVEAASGARMQVEVSAIGAADLATILREFAH